MIAHLMLAALVVGQDLDAERFAKLRDQIRPGREELKWQAIPWHIALRDAVVAAQQQEKPILLYAMNGHPLACV